MESSSTQKDPLSNLLDILLSRKLLLTVGFFSIFSIVVAGISLLPPEYEAHTSIYISAPTLPRVEVPYLSEIASRGFLKNQTTVIESRLVLEKVVKELELHKAKKNESTIITRIKNLIYRQFNIIKPTPDPVERAIDDLRDSINVYLPRGSNITYISASAKTSQSAALFANTVADTYVNYANSLYLSKAKSGYDYLERQVSDAKAKLSQSDIAFNEFKKKEKAFSITEESSIIIQKISELEEQYEETKLQIEEANRQIIRIKSNKDFGQNSDRGPYLNPEVKELNDQLRQLENELAAARGALRDEHPDVKALRKRINQITIKLEQAKSNTTQDVPSASVSAAQQNPMLIDIEGIEREKESLQLRQDSLINQRKNLEQRLTELTNKQFVYEKLLREFEANQQILKTLKDQLEAARILKANDTNQGSIRVIDKAFPPLDPLKKKRNIFLLIGLVVSTIFSVGMVLVAEHLDDSLKTPDEAENYFDLPVLGVIPKSTMRLRRY